MVVKSEPSLIQLRRYFCQPGYEGGGRHSGEGFANGVFAEEATKVLLRDMNDKDKLVRQDDYWINKKQEWYAALHNQNDEELDNE